MCLVAKCVPSGKVCVMHSSLTCSLNLDGLSPETIQVLSAGRKKQKATEGDDEAPHKVSIILNFKRYIFDPNKRMIQ